MSLEELARVKLKSRSCSARLSMLRVQMKILTTRLSLFKVSKALREVVDQGILLRAVKGACTENPSN